MRYQMLLWPHANARYQSESVRLAAAELRLMLDRLAPEAAIRAGGLPDMPCLELDYPQAPDDAVIAAICRHSLMYGLFEERDGLLRPVAGRAAAKVGADLPSILKYKGKTNEMFLQLLVNAALYAGDFWRDADEPLALLDPMCGRATTLFVAANLGWDATGADVDKNDLKEAEKFFKRYLEYHRLKHGVSRASRTLRQGGSAPECRFDYAPDDKASRRALTLLQLDASRGSEALGKSAFHLIACDLPYGVRHDAQPAPGARMGGDWLEGLLRRALPQWRAVLKPGGSVALSFNAQSFKAGRLRALMAEAGFQVMEGGPWDGFSHWVEQAITRDIVVGVKELPVASSQ